MNLNFLCRLALIIPELALLGPGHAGNFNLNLIFTCNICKIQAHPLNFFIIIEEGICILLWVDVFKSMIIHTANVRNFIEKRNRTVSHCGSRNSNYLKNYPRNTTVLSTWVEKLLEKVIVFHRFLLGRLGMLCWKDPWKLYFTLHKVRAVHKQHSLYCSLHFTNLTTTISMVCTLIDHQSSRPISARHKIADIAKSELWINDLHKTSNIKEM